MVSRELGNWIHLQYDHYERVGTNLVKKGNDSLLVIANHRKIIRNLGKSLGSNKKTRQELEKRYNFFFNVMSGEKIENVFSQIYDADFVQKVAEWTGNALVQAITKLGGKDMSHTNLDSSSLSASVVNVSNISSKKFRALQGNGINSKKALDRRWTQLKKDYQSIDLTSGIISQADIAKIENIQKNYEKYWQEYSQKTGRSDWIYSEGFSELRTIVDDINDLSSRIKSEIDKEAQGLAGEFGALLGPYLYHLFETNQIESMLEETFVKGFLEFADQNRRGDKLSINVYQTDKFLQPRNDEERAAFDIGAIAVNLIKHQPQGVKQKVDIRCSLPGWPDDYFVGASVKNVRGNRLNILSSGEGILYKVLQLDTAFGNHFLNITASHDEALDSHPNETTLQLYRRLAKWSVAAYALAGGLAGPGKRFGQEEAQFFVWNNPSSPGYKVYMISDIISQMERNVEDIVTFEESGGSIDDTWDNTRYGVGNSRNLGRVRILKLLAQVQKIKLDVKLNMNNIVKIYHPSQK